MNTVDTNIDARPITVRRITFRYPGLWTATTCKAIS